MNRSALPLLPLLLGLALLPACRDGEHEQASEEPEPWSVTAWSEHYELFAETEPLVAGREAASHAHFTVLQGFSALDRGAVTGILRGAGGREETFHAPAPLRPGIFRVVFRPAREGTFDLVFRVEEGGRREDIAAGRVRVGTAESPGGLVEPPPGTPAAGAAGEPIGFLKEQQWRTELVIARAATGTLRRTLRAPATVRPAAGGEVTLTAPTDGVVTSARWPHVGLDAARGMPLFTIAPRLESDRSLSELGAEVAALEAELGAARARLARLRELIAVEAASRREVEEAEAAVRALAARLEASRRGRAAVSAVRRGGAGPESFRVAAPIAGRVAEVAVSPGQFVEAGAPLARLVQTSPVWLELALQPAQAAALTAAPAGLYVRRWASEEPFPVPGSELRLVARAPEVDAGTGMVPLVLEVRRGVDVLRLGSRVEAELLLPEELTGVVVPASALIDDDGVEVVYVQLEGESFERREVRIEARQGPHVLVRGIARGERIVTRGGNAIRRSSLLGSGAVEGHVH